MQRSGREDLNRRMLRARDETDRCYTEPLDVPRLAAVAHLSTSQFGRAFKAVYGETPHRYLQRSEMSMSTTSQTFRTTLAATGGNNVGIVVPDDVVASFDRGRRVPVSVTVDGTYTYSGSIAWMGGRYLVSFNAATRKATGRGAGDVVEIRLEVDDAPREVAVPADLQAAFDATTGAGTAWASLSSSRRRAHVDSITAAKTTETRRRRITTVLDSLDISAEQASSQRSG